MTLLPVPLSLLWQPDVIIMEECVANQTKHVLIVAYLAVEPLYCAR